MRLIATMQIMNFTDAGWAVTAGLVVAVVGLLCTAAVLWLREQGLLPLRKFASFRGKSLAEFALIAVVVGGFVQYGATKTNGGARGGCESLLPTESAEAQSGSWSAETAGWGQPALPMRTGSGLYFLGIEPQTNGVAIAIALPDGGIIGNTLDLFCTTNLLAAWSLLGEVPVGVSASTAVVFVARTDMPDSPAIMPSAAFFDAATHDDTDGDGLYDGREIRLHGTDSARWDTDGDGLADGYEVVQGLSPLLIDTDADGYPDDEEIAAQTDPLSPNAGASGSIRYFYDDDDRLAAAYVGTGGKASITGWTPSGDPADSLERGLEE